MAHSTITAAQAEEMLRRFQPKLASVDQLAREYGLLNIDEGKVLAGRGNFHTAHKCESLNRYCNVLPIESTIYPPSCRSDFTKYFGASTLDATELGLPLRFIAHQAPVPDCIGAFWSGVYEARPIAIVMLTRITEGGKHKADQYWPTAEGQTWEMPNGLLVSNLGAPRQKAAASASCPPTPDKNNTSTSSNSSSVSSVNNQQQQQLQLHQPQVELKTPTRAIGNGLGQSPPPTPGSVCDSIINTVIIVRPKGTPEDDASGKVHRTVLTRYESWPDHGVPSTTGGVQRMFEELDHKIWAHQQHSKQQQQQQQQPPSVFVHCSAGIGRTGTFIGGFICRDMFRRGVFDPENGVCNVVKWMKQRRPGSVQQCEQYLFLHKLLNSEMTAGVQLLRSQQAASRN